MARRPNHTRQRDLPPQKRHPRVPTGERVLREGAWWTTEHPGARWFRVVGQDPDWSTVRLELADDPDAAEGRAFTATIRPDGLIVVPPQLDLGPEAIRILGTAIRAAQRRAD
jgi:hypothetical protein